MPAARITPDLEMHYEVDDYTDPWTRPETVLLLHGNAESAAMWFGWVPTLARHFRVVRTDMRGFARSTPMPRDYQWTHKHGAVHGARKVADPIAASFQASPRELCVVTSDYNQQPNRTSA